MADVATTTKLKRLPTLTPRNGRYLVLLLAGGPADRARELRNVFAERRGALIKYHWDYDRERAFQRAIPKDVDLVIILRSMVGHAQEHLVVAAAKAAKLPFVRTDHKLAIMDGALRQRFVWHKAPALPLEVTSTAYLRVADEGAPAPVVASVVPAVPVAAATAAEPVPPPDTLLQQRIETARKDTMTLVRELQARLAMIGPEATCMIDSREATFYMGKPPRPGSDGT